MRFMSHNWSATKQRPHPQSVAEISRHSVLSGDSIRQCETSSGSRHKDTDQCLSVAISFCRHCSVLVPCENGSAETTVVEGGRNPVARLWDNTLGENWPPETTSSYASIDFWLRTCEVSRFNSNSIQTSRFDSIRKWRADSTISNRRACHVCHKQHSLFNDKFQSFRHCYWDLYWV